jgi:hypothetical protein
MARKAPDEDRKLARQIRATATSRLSVRTELATSQRIIARVTDGIYREPWAAFRELAANAYDADATRVIIETGAPAFDQVVIRDDGMGMSPETIAYVVRHIGGSSKRTKTGTLLHTVNKDDPDRSPGGRMLIGKIGIGLFAVAQLTQHFQIITKARGENIRTSATLLLRTHEEESLLQKKPDSKYIAGEVRIRSEKVSDDEKSSHGTTVILYSLRPEVRRTLQSVRRWNAVLSEEPESRLLSEPPLYHIGISPKLLASSDKGREAKLPWRDSDSPKEKFTKFVKAAGEVSERGNKPANLDHFDEYLRLIWQLSLSLPLAYVGQHPFDFKGSSGLIFFSVPPGRGQASQLKLRSDQTIRDLLSLTAGTPDPAGGFDVFVDDVLLRRPIELSTSLRTKSRIPAPAMMAANEMAPFKGKDLDRAGGRLKFDAYLYWNSKIIPKETAGVLVRVREASGTLFDASFLKYQVSEQTRLRQITAEIFVNEGLDSAINIDRESFNFSHPHFLYIQRWLHRALRLLVNRLKAIADEDLQKEKARRAQQQQKTKQSVAARIWSERLGEDADPPVPDAQSDKLPTDIGGTRINWPARASQGDTPTTIAIAIVLEAYGVLSNLSARERSNLIDDLLKILHPRDND